MAPFFTGITRAIGGAGFGKRAGGVPPILTVIKPDTTTTTIDLAIADFNFSTAGPYTITVNGGPKAVLLKSWGSGGKEGYDGPGAGGGGGYAEGIISLQEGISYQVVIGSGGGTAPTYAPGNAPIPYGGGGSQVGYDSPGGGFSGLFITSISHANSVLISGGGGGTYPGTSGSYVGGGGGGTTGQDASTPYLFTISGGGTQGAGGTAGSAAGAGATAGAGGALVGGAGHPVAGGGGGGGYYGGGGGGGSAGQGQQGAGGGGSGYTNPSYILSPVLIQASGSTAANGSDPDRGTAGNGGDDSTGSPGRFIIRLI